MPKKASTTCPRCRERQIKWRGVCIACYHVARRQIAKGETTDEQLVQLGFWQPPGQVVRGASAQALKKLLGK